jgi:cytochrome oxidase Cu insertion factor (SCO1/SenC/PrrC family)
MTLGTRLLLSALLTALGVYAGYVGYRIWDRAQPYADVKSTLHLKPVRNLDEFEFTERSGKHVKLGDLKGEIYVVNFFFATCPGSCRQFSSTISGLQEEFKNDDVRFLSVTVDPSKDTPERLANYAKDIGADADKWWFLTAPLGDTQELGRSLHVSVAGEAHTDELVIVDRTGTIRGAYDHKNSQKLAKFKADLTALLKEQPRGEIKTEKKDAE